MTTLTQNIPNRQIHTDRKSNSSRWRLGAERGLLPTGARISLSGNGNVPGAQRCKLQSTDGFLKTLPETHIMKSYADI